MVFCGKPSKGCLNCRKRRIKCDLVEPSCSQCIRSVKECPGYRDLQALMFRDENAKVIRKVRVPESGSRKRHDSSSSSLSPPVQQETPEELSEEANKEQILPTTDLVTLGGTNPEFQSFLESKWIYLQAIDASIPTCRITTAFHDKGIGFFFNNYMTFWSSTKNGGLDVLQSPLWREVTISQQVFDAVASVGLAGLSNVTKDQRGMMEARKKYSETLQLVRIALQKPNEADLDHVFKAIMILAMFEIVNSTSEVYNNWGIHIDGAVALLRSGALKKFEKRRASRMQLQFCFSTLMNYLQRGEPFPDVMMDWTRKCRAVQPPAEIPSGILLDILIRFINLQASIKATGSLDPSLIVSEALQMDRELEDWVSSDLPDIWEYETVVDETPNLFNNRYHIYRDLWVAKSWNHYRWARILVNNALLVHMARGVPFPGYEAQQRKSLALITNLATDICTSVSSEICRHAVQYDYAKNRAPQMSGIFMVLSPLTAAGSAIGVPEETHLWVQRLLRNIGNTLGIMQALTLIPRMEIMRERWKGARLDVVREGNAGVFVDGNGWEWIW